jgi:hypothetical protein
LEIIASSKQDTGGFYETSLSKAIHEGTKKYKKIEWEEKARNKVHYLLNMLEGAKLTDAGAATVAF